MPAPRGCRSHPARGAQHSQQRTPHPRPHTRSPLPRTVYLANVASAPAEFTTLVSRDDEAPLPVSRPGPSLSILYKSIIRSHDGVYTPGSPRVGRAGDLGSHGSRTVHSMAAGHSRVGNTSGNIQFRPRPRRQRSRRPGRSCSRRTQPGPTDPPAGPLWQVGVPVTHVRLRPLEGGETAGHKTPSRCG